MALRDIIRRMAPPVFLDLARKVRGAPSGGASGISGDFACWREALAASTGYDSPAIVRKTKAAMLKVRDGEAACERDSALFDSVQYSWPVLAGLLWAAARAGGRLDVLDFGGSLGSTYFQQRAFLRELPDVRWNIVEQPAHVEEGKRSFESDRLRFYPSVDACLSETAPNAVLISSVLQYLERPYEVLTSLLGLPCTCVIIDRTPFWRGERDVLKVQRVAPGIFDASIPAWVFSRRAFDEYARRRGTVVAEFDSLDNVPGLEYKGFILSPAGAPDGTSHQR